MRQSGIPTERQAKLNYLYTKAAEVLDLCGTARHETVNKAAHETLVLACHEGLKDSEEAYGNLFTQVTVLCKLHNIPVADRIEIQRFRWHTNHSSPVEKDDFLYGMMALCRFISAVTGDGVPETLLRRLPIERRRRDRQKGIDVRYVRCIANSWDEKYIYVSTELGQEGMTVAVDRSAEELSYLGDMLRENMQLNLLDSKMDGTGAAGAAAKAGAERVITPGLVVVEPDCLLDISTVAACFKDYGHHPLTYIIDRMRRRANTSAILLGNLAGSILDNVTNHGDEFSMPDTMRGNFRDKALEYCTCGDFSAEKFKRDAAVQEKNIKDATGILFKSYDRSKVLLEPSFVCERLGLQGRVDMMTEDFRLLVEQKSGRNMNIEYGGVASGKMMQLEPHYVQLMLYYGVLRYNFNLGIDRTDCRLLYSKYPPRQGLVAVNFYRKLFQEAIKVRNMIVHEEMRIALEGFGTVLPELTPGTVNTEDAASTFYKRYQLPQIEQVTEPLKGMSELEREYLCRMMTFVCREQMLSKVGTQEGVGGCTADLWNMPLAEKVETGNIYTGLRIVRKERDEGSCVPDRITLSVPQQGESFLPNFRRGDMVYLYRYREGHEPDVRQAILYKGSIDALRTREITVVLANGQQNPGVLTVQDGGDTSCYAIEHAGGGSGGDKGAAALHELITAPEARRRLLLGQREPRRNPDTGLTRSYSPGYDDIILAEKQAEDYYLLVGPPGTGKTSMALRFMVEEELAAPDASVLLTAYTNRAVDEICSMLDDAGIDYVRIGSKFSCDRQFHHRMLDDIAASNPRLRDMRTLLKSVRVITATTSMLMSRPFIFDIKTFSLAIVDEASQILEPNIIGMLSAHRAGSGGQDSCRIRRFVLVGDHKQLPAVVRQGERESAVTSKLLNDICLDNCRNSLFERLLRLERKAGRTEFTGVLRHYGRMHPEVAEFPFREFYAEEQLVPVPLRHQQETELHRTGTGDRDRLDTLLRTHRMIFIKSPLCRRPDISDKVNTAEAKIVADLLRRIRLMAADGFDARKTAGVIVPYRNQIAVIRKEIEALGMPELEDVSIDTVERYQGSQRDVIIYSFTVQNTWQLEFLTANSFTENGRAIDRKLNVAITRARLQMIMTGNVATLSADSTFTRLLRFIEQKGGMIEAEQPLTAEPGNKD